MGTRKKTKTIRLKLKPSARDKRRYFVTFASQKKVEEAILEYIGVLGFARAAYEPVKDPFIKGTIGSCLASSLNDVRSSLLITGISITKVSGTLKGLRTP